MKEGVDSPAIAFIALKSDKFPSEKEVKKSLAEYFGKEVKLTDIDVDSEEENISLSINGTICMLAMLDKPIPWEDLEGPCQTAYFWKEATVEMKAHKAHYICMMLGGETKLQQTLHLTKAMAAVAETSDTAGIYWGNATLVTKPETFIEQAKEATEKNPLVKLWVDFRMWAGKNGKYNTVSTGLEEFGKMEVEILGSEREPGDVYSMAVSAAYLQLVGDVFEDGDTIGFDAKTKIPTKHAASTWDREGKVLLVDF